MKSEATGTLKRKDLADQVRFSVGFMVSKNIPLKNREKFLKRRDEDVEYQSAKRAFESALEALEATDAKRDARLAQTLLNDLLELAPEVDYVADQINEVGEMQSHRLSQVKYERTMDLLAKLGGRMRRAKAEIADALDATADADKRTSP